MNIDFEQKVLLIDDSRWISFEEICDSICVSNKDVVYIGGSLVEGHINPLSFGMGNKFSDVDVFIIREHNAVLKTECVYDGNVRRTFFCEKKQCGFDVEVYDKDFVNVFAEVLNRVEVAPNERINNVFFNYLPQGCNFELLNTFLCRLYNSICIKGEEAYKELQNKIKYRKFLDLLISKTIVSIDNIYEDVQGNVEAGQLDVALYCARRIVLNVMFVVLMKNSIFTDREKWIPLKFSNLCRFNKKFLTLNSAFKVLFRGDLSKDIACNNAIVDTMRVSKQVIETILMEELQL